MANLPPYARAFHRELVRLIQTHLDYSHPDDQVYMLLALVTEAARGCAIGGMSLAQTTTALSTAYAAALRKVEARDV